MMTTEDKRQVDDLKTRTLDFGISCLWILGALLIASGIAVRMSIMTSSVRMLLVATFIFTLFTGVVFLFKVFKRRPALFFPTIFFLALFIVWAVLANKPPDTKTLRAVYVRRLVSFYHTRYVLGGETDTGIDCSGLARVALWQAMLRDGIKEFNPRLLGTTLWKFWWRDIGARDMGECKYGYTRVIEYVPKLAGCDTSNLKEGDIAVASSVHVMIYVGKGRWIEANPDDGKVVVNKTSASSKRGWFNTPATIVRWWILDK